MKILTLNIGSTSLKAQGFDFPDERAVLKLKYQIDREKQCISCGEDCLSFTEMDDPYQVCIEHLSLKAHEQKWDAVVHRFVHGGDQAKNPTLITKTFIEEIKSWIPLLPLHLPFNIEGALSCEKAFEGVPQWACFDNACYLDFEPHVYRYALPKNYYQKHLVRRYGYHGLSHDYAVKELCANSNFDLNQIKVISCHLGGGSSISAFSKGRFVDTSMGMTAVSGLPMTTRSGDVDPAVVFHLLRESGLSASDLEDVFYKKSGLKGTSELSGDMRELLDSRIKNPQANLAVKLFIYQIQKQIGAFYAVLGGVDALIFTGGIGENSSVIRSEVCQGLSHLSLNLDEARNQTNDFFVSSSKSLVKLAVVPCDEGLYMARQVYEKKENT